MSTEDMEERDVEEADWRGESEGLTAADDSESFTVVDVTVRRSTGLLGFAAPVEVEADAMMGLTISSLALW